MPRIKQRHDVAIFRAIRRSRDGRGESFPWRKPGGDLRGKRNLATQNRQVGEQCNDDEYKRDCNEESASMPRRFRNHGRNHGRETTITAGNKDVVPHYREETFTA